MNLSRLDLDGRKFVALAGGVGGAKLVDGLAHILSPEELTIVVNTGDDFEHLGLFICPDLDTVCYTLAGMANPITGWGLADETWNAMESLARLGGPTWFRLGDRDLGTHLERTRRLRMGEPLSKITHDFCKTWGISHTVLPMSDQPVPTFVLTDMGELAFQDYFVRQQCTPKVNGFRYKGVEEALPAPGVVESLERADVVIICPSNPWVSIHPILTLPGIKPVLQNKCVIAISPLIGGEAVKGPAAKIYQEMGIEPSALSVAYHYKDLLAGFVLDTIDRRLAITLESRGLKTLVTDILMKTGTDRCRLAREVLEFAMKLSEEKSPKHLSL